MLDKDTLIDYGIVLLILVFLVLLARLYTLYVPETHNQIDENLLPGIYPYDPNYAHFVPNLSGDNLYIGLMVSDLINTKVYNKKIDCSICLVESEDTIVRELKCKHVFHSDCIDKWLSNHNTCPMCRSKIN